MVRCVVLCRHFRWIEDVPKLLGCRLMATIQALSILHWAGVYSGLLAVPVGIVVLAILFMVAVLIRDAIRRARCQHTDVRFRRQEHNYQHYFAEVCMHCGKSSMVKQ